MCFIYWPKSYFHFIFVGATHSGMKSEKTYCKISEFLKKISGRLINTIKIKPAKGKKILLSGVKYYCPSRTCNSTAIPYCTIFLLRSTAPDVSFKNYSSISANSTGKSKNWNQTLGNSSTQFPTEKKHTYQNLIETTII